MKDQWLTRAEPGSRLIPLNDEFVVPARFVAENDTVSLQIEVDENGPRCRAIEVRGDRLTSDDLRLPLARMLRQVVATAALPAARRGTDAHRFATVVGQKPRDREFYRQYVADTDRPRRGKSITDEQLQRVADAYRAAMEHGDPPTQTIAAVMHASRPTAARWVARARERGMLGESLPGKAGEKVAVS